MVEAAGETETDQLPLDLAVNQQFPKLFYKISTL